MRPVGRNWIYSKSSGLGSFGAMRGNMDTTRRKEGLSGAGSIHQKSDIILANKSSESGPGRVLRSVGNSSWQSNSDGSAEQSARENKLVRRSPRPTWGCRRLKLPKRRYRKA